MELTVKSMRKSLRSIDISSIHAFMKKKLGDNSYYNIITSQGEEKIIEMFLTKRLKEYKKNRPIEIFVAVLLILLLIYILVYSRLSYKEITSQPDQEEIMQTPFGKAKPAVNITPGLGMIIPCIPMFAAIFILFRGITPDGADVINFNEVKFNKHWPLWIKAPIMFGVGILLLWVMT